MTYLHCARCGGRFEPDENHAWVSVEYKQIDDRNKTNEYALCTGCWLDLRDNWNEPV